MIKRIAFLFLFISLLMSFSRAQAQTPTPPPGPVYIIQPGDSLSSIASQFGVSLNDLMTANSITDANNIAAGAQVIIPGLQGISGILNTEPIGYGDTLSSLSRRNQVDEDFLRKLNHITSPSELYAGVPVVLPQKADFTPLTRRIVLIKGESLLEAAVGENSDPWTISQVNSLKGTWDSLPGDVLYNPTGSDSATVVVPNGMPSAFVKVGVSPLPLTQGGTTVITVQTQPGVTLGGMLVDKPLHFFATKDGNFVALQGVYAMLDPGPYPLKLEATLPDGSKQSFEQMVVVKPPATPYPNDPMLAVDPATIDPAITGPENDQIASITAPVTTAKLWDGIFQLPVDQVYCLKSWFGNRRAYNGGGYDNFHAGLDFGICSPDHPFDIYAPADGVVVFTGKLVVRGNATVIDHGWGIYTGYWHQEEILVKVGDHVKAGQLIGHIGQTGRVTGPHLHWEVWVNGIQVDPLQWLGNTYP
jgi:murein DD-endopeptidase MepM/ murein hydrolase activator NlpD